MRILLIEDDPDISSLIELMLSNDGMTINATNLGEDGIELAKLYENDLILLDLNLPDMSGYDVLRHLRFAQIDTPVLILSGVGDTENKIKGFDFGAADFLTKPFVREELFARMHAIIRRSRGFAQSTIRMGRVEINLETKFVGIEGKAVDLTYKEYQILELLSLRSGKTLSKEVFLNHLYGGLDEPDIKIIDVFICRLRKKLAMATDGEDMIETVQGRGYRLLDPSPSL